MIDDVVLYGRALSSSEVTSMYLSQQSNNILYHTDIVRGSTYAVCRNNMLTVPQSECEALMNMFVTNNGPSWLNTSNRGVNPNVDLWFGITVQT